MANVVRVETTIQEEIAKSTAFRRPVLLTSKGFLKRRNVVADVAQLLDPALQVVSIVSPNPSIGDVFELSEKLSDFDGVIALGGGSVLDTAKAVIWLKAIGGDKQKFWDFLTDKTECEVQSSSVVPLIAVPTTAGTGSEVNSQATLWGAEGEKYSLKHRVLMPSQTLIDPYLTLTQSSTLTRACALDAFSHAIETIWNVRCTKKSLKLAQNALKVIYIYLPKVLSFPESVEYRKELQDGAILAGLAMRETQTAIAHSISYPLTSKCNIPHGIACSFTIPAIVEFVEEKRPGCVLRISEALGCEPKSVANCIRFWLKQVGIAEELGQLSVQQALLLEGDQLILSERARNFICKIDEVSAFSILQQSLIDFGC